MTSIANHPDCGYAGKLVEQLCAVLDPIQQERRRQRVGGGGAAGDHGDSHRNPGRRARPGIEDLAVLMGRGRGAVPEQQNFARAERDRPPVLAGWDANRRDGASAGIDERVPDPLRPENRDRALHGVAFSNAAEVQLYAVGAKANAIGSAQLDLLGADTPPRLRNFARGRTAASCVRLLPRPEQRRDRDVEPAAREAEKRNRLLDDFVQAGIDDDEFALALAIQLRQVAVGLVVAHHLVEADDLLHRLPDRALGVSA
jgi:hypothetical protein